MKNRHLLLCSLLTITSHLAGCGSGLVQDVEITQYAVSPTIVQAPTANTPVTFNISLTIEAEPKAGSISFAATEIKNANQPDKWAYAPLGFRFQCGDRDFNCPSGTYQTNCTISLITGAASNKRRMLCQGKLEAMDFDAGTYLYFFGVLSDIGAFAGTDSDEKTGEVIFL